MSYAPGYLLSSANSIYHDGFRQFLIEEKIVDRWLSEDFSRVNDPSPFLEYYPRWIESSKLNSVRGLRSYPFRYPALGVTQALEDWQYLCLAKQWRLRVMAGEYPYLRDTSVDWREEQTARSLNFRRGDALVISAPFSATGSVHQDWDEILSSCLANDVPIFVDAAFFGTCGGIDLDLFHPAIKVVSFSTTKGLGCGNWRAGITFSRIKLPRLELQDKWRHGVHLNVQLSLELMRKFSPDFIFETYRADQLAVCEIIGLKPTPCAHLALGDEKWNQFSRDGVANRVGLAKAARDFHRGKKIAWPD